MNQYCPSASYLNGKGHLYEERRDPQAANEEVWGALKENVVLWHLQIWSKKQSSHGTKHRVRMSPSGLGTGKNQPCIQQNHNCSEGLSILGCRRKGPNEMLWPWLG